jgi:hypothetical protein
LRNWTQIRGRHRIDAVPGCFNLSDTGVESTKSIFWLEMADETDRAAEQQLTDRDAAMVQLAENQRILDYDTKEFTVELLVRKFGVGGDEDDIFVPRYQRNFNWDERRQSRFIESLLLGLPVPFFFFGDTVDGRLEVVDGRQRLGTCAAFLGGKLELIGLERLELLNGYGFHSLSKSQQRRFRNRTIRSVVLSQHATEEDRRDMFDRINTGSLAAEPVELRRGAIAGPVSDLIDELANDARFQRLCPVSIGERNKREGEELVTRLLAFSDGLGSEYRDRIGKYLDRWLKEKNSEAEKTPETVAGYRTRFQRIMGFVEAHFPNGFKKKSAATTTPRGRFDAIGVGVWLAIQEDSTLEETGPKIRVADWLDSDDFFTHTTSSAANVRSRILNRTEYVKYMLLGNAAAATEILHGKE